jgi:hypothetical protein
MFARLPPEVAGQAEAERAAAEGPDGAWVTLRGRLAGDATGRVATRYPADIARIERADASATSTQDGAVHLHTTLGEITFEEPPHVLLTPHEPEMDARDGVTRELRVGEEVFAIGRLRKVARAAQHAGGYRDEGATYVLSARSAQDAGAPFHPVQLLHVQPASSRALRQASGVLLALVVASALVASNFRATGNATGAREASQSAAGAQGAGRGEDPGCATLRAAMRGNDPLRAVAGFRLQPDGSFSARCAPSWEAEVLTVAGRFSDASRAYVRARAEAPDLAPSLGEAEVHALAGENREAARVVDAIAIREPAHAAELRCVALAYGRRAGDTAAVEALQRLAADQWTPELRTQARGLRDDLPVGKQPEACRIVLDAFALSEWPARGPFGALYPIEQRANRWVLGYDDLGVRTYNSSMGLLLAPESRTFHLALPLFASAARALEHETTQSTQDQERRAQLAIPVAGFLAFMGDRDAASTWLANHVEPIALRVATEQAARNPAERVPADMWNTPPLEILRRGAAVALLAGDVPRATRWIDLADQDAHAAGTLRQYVRQTTPGAAFEEPIEDRNWGENRALLASTDPKDAAEKLAAHGYTGRQVLARMMARLPARDPHLVAWYKEKFPLPCPRCGLWQLAAYVGDKRHAARMLGLDDEEARWRPVAEAFIAAVLQRDGAEEWLALERVIGPRPPW